MDVHAAQVRFPRLFQHLRAAGWSEGRSVPPPAEWLARAADLGFFPDDYQEEFLQAFGALEVTARVQNERGRISYGSVFVGLGNQLDQMNARDHVGYIKRLAETGRVFPVMMSGGNAVFCLDDGRCLAIEVTFRGCAWAPDPFAMMDWLLFASPGAVAVRALTMDERPPTFRW